MSRPDARTLFTIISVLALTIAPIGCSPNSRQPLPSAAASPTGFCSDLGGSWDQQFSACTATVTNAKNHSVKVTAGYPLDLIEDPTAGPVLQDFVRQFFGRFTRRDDSLAQDGSARLTYRVAEHAPATKSVVFTDDWNLGGPHPNDEINTFTFDLTQRKRLALADLFCPGIDPQLPDALSPYVQRYVQPPVDPGWLQPGGQGVEYSAGYRAWAMEADDLLVLMPAARAGAVHAGAFKARIPLSTMRPILRDGGCTA